MKIFCFDSIRRFARCSVLLLSAAMLSVSCEKDDVSNSDSFKSGNMMFSFGLASDNGIIKHTHDADEGSTRLVLNGEDGSEPLYLDVVVEEGISHGADRRSDDVDEDIVGAAPVTALTIRDAGIFAFNFQGEWSEFLKPDFMHNFRVAKDTEWKTDRNFPGNSSKMRFYAYSPYNCEGVSVSPKEYSGAPAIIYTVPSSVYSQQDLLVGKTQDIVCSTAPKQIELNFNHALTAVKFVTGSDLAKGQIKSLMISGVYTKGKCSLDYSSAPQWSDLSLKGDFSLMLNRPSIGTSGEMITSEEQTFMLLPQVVPDGAKIDVVISVNGTERRLTGDIGGQNWKAGTTVVYKVSSSGVKETYEFSVRDMPAFSAKGGRRQCVVTSYAYDVARNKVPVGWTAQFSTDGGSTWHDAKPGWLGTFTTVNTDKEPRTNPETVSFPVRVAAAQESEVVDHSKALRENEPKKGIWNLSNSTGASPIENTANCYLVNSAGTYSIPLVYGNGITNGRENRAAFASYRSGNDVLRIFPDHTNHSIASPYIVPNIGATSDYSIKSVSVLWQDAPLLIANPRLSADGHSILFDVNRSTITQGNAVIGIIGAKGVIWSWHIWVTDLKLDDRYESCYGEDVPVATRPNYSSEADSKYYMMPVNLGWCSNFGSFYKTVKTLVKFTQAGSGKTAILAIVRNGAPNGNLLGNNPYYQWGRKDPFPGALQGGNKTWYDHKGNQYTKNFNYFPHNWQVYMSIYSPMSFCTNINQASRHCNLWNMDDDGASSYTAETKTIFDPCPVGYMIPNRQAFTNFTNPTGSFKNGYMFASINHEETIFMPASGFRSGRYRGEAYYIGLTGCYYTLNPDYKCKTMAYVFVIDATKIRNDGSTIRTDAFSVRPVREAGFKR